MLVGVTGFGSVWRHRIREDGSDRRRFAHASYFNTTGVVVNGRLVRRRKIAGHVRLDGVSGFNPNYPSRAIGKVFECAKPCVWQGQNKILFKRLLHSLARPDYFLVAARSAEVGRLDLTVGNWKSDDTLLISLSESPDQQEALLFMPDRGFIRTALGRFFLEPVALQRGIAHLQIETRLGDTSCVTQKARSS
jgi:hypothetical protein